MSLSGRAELLCRLPFEWEIDGIAANIHFKLGRSSFLKVLPEIVPIPVSR
jgi:hypothetical protein